jgi:hypothetical protein
MGAMRVMEASRAGGESRGGALMLRGLALTSPSTLLQRYKIPQTAPPRELFLICHY